MTSERVNTGHTDNNGAPLYDGDQMRIPKHIGSMCCEHTAQCTVRFNKEWDKWGLQDNADGEWLCGDGLFAGFSKSYC